MVKYVTGAPLAMANYIAMRRGDYGRVVVRYYEHPFVRVPPRNRSDEYFMRRLR